MQPCGCVEARICVTCLQRWMNRVRLPRPVVDYEHYESENTVNLRQARAEVLHEQRYTHCGICKHRLDLNMVEATIAAQVAHTAEVRQQLVSDNNMARTMEDRQNLPFDDQETSEEARARENAERMEVRRQRIHGEYTPQEAPAPSSMGPDVSARASAQPRATTTCGYCGEEVSIDIQLHEHFKVCTEQLLRRHTRRALTLSNASALDRPASNSGEAAGGEARTFGNANSREFAVRCACPEIQMIQLAPTVAAAEPTARAPLASPAFRNAVAASVGLRDTSRPQATGNASQEAAAASNMDTGFSHESAAIALASLHHGDSTAASEGQSSATETTDTVINPRAGFQPPPPAPAMEPSEAAPRRPASPREAARAAIAAAIAACLPPPSDAAATGGLRAIQFGSSNLDTLLPAVSSSQDSHLVVILLTILLVTIVLMWMWVRRSHNLPWPATQHERRPLHTTTVQQTAVTTNVTNTTPEDEKAPGSPRSDKRARELVVWKSSPRKLEPFPPATSEYIALSHGVKQKQAQLCGSLSQHIRTPAENTASS